MGGTVAVTTKILRRLAKHLSPSRISPPIGRASVSPARNPAAPSSSPRTAPINASLSWAAPQPCRPTVGRGEIGAIVYRSAPERARVGPVAGVGAQQREGSERYASEYTSSSAGLLCSLLYRGSHFLEHPPSRYGSAKRDGQHIPNHAGQGAGVPLALSSIAASQSRRATTSPAGGVDDPGRTGI